MASMLRDFSHSNQLWQKALFSCSTSHKVCPLHFFTFTASLPNCEGPSALDLLLPGKKKLIKKKPYPPRNLRYQTLASCQTKCPFFLFTMQQIELTQCMKTLLFQSEKLVTMCYQYQLLQFLQVLRLSFYCVKIKNTSTVKDKQTLWALPWRND